MSETATVPDQTERATHPPPVIAGPPSLPPPPGPTRLALDATALPGRALTSAEKTNPSVPKQLINGELRGFTPAELSALAASTQPARRPPISAMQLSAALLMAGKITASEARAFGRAGTIPPSIEPAIVASLTAAGLDANAREIALLQLESATEYHRDHPITPLIGTAMQMDAAALDVLWDAAAQVV